MKTKNLMSSVTNVALGAGGAVASKMAGSYLPESIDPMYVSIGKIVLGALAPSFLKAKDGSAIAAIAQGVAIEGALSLVESPGVISGLDNGRTALRGYDYGHSALTGSYGGAWTEAQPAAEVHTA